MKYQVLKFYIKPSGRSVFKETSGSEILHKTEWSECILMKYQVLKFYIRQSGRSVY